MSKKKDDEIEGLRQELRRYTSWQPSDPGTKEAMPRSDEKCDTHEDRPVVSHCPYCSWFVLADALRAAMVRLEEAEKKADVVA